MALSREQKEEVVAKLDKVFKDSETVAFVNFHGLGVEDTTTMRSRLAEEGVGYTVAKKSLLRRALKNVKAEGEVPALEGELALAYGSETEPARGVHEFGKEHEGTLTLLGGIFEGHFIDAEKMNEIAQIPSLDVLRGMFVNLIFSPVQRLAITLDQIAQKNQ